jgi:hypothetical protein
LDNQKKSSNFAGNFVTMRQIITILLVLATIFIGCDNKITTETSTECRVNNFTFVEDTLNPGLTEVTYKTEHRRDTGLIYCKDSLRFGTRLDSVVPYITYKATPGSATFYLPNDTIVSTGVDTIDLTQQPVYLHVMASDMKTEKWYRIDIHAHKINPNLYVWTKLADNIFPQQNCETKAFYVQNQFVLYVNNGLTTTVYKSSDAITWGKAQMPSNLPTPCHVRDIVQHEDTLYYIDKEQLYMSTNHINWTLTDYATATFEPINMLLTYNNKAWCLIQDRSTNQLQLATIQNGEITPQTNIDGLIDGYLPDNFPINDFAATSFESSSERPRAMIVGGRSINGNPINTRWNMEYIKASNTYRLKDFTISQPTFHTLTGASIVQYGGQLIMFGGIDNDLEWNSNILYSDDEGMHWYAPSPSVNQLPQEYQSRQYQSVIKKQNSLFIIGGQSHNQSFSDVYRGQLNSLL